MPVRPPSSRIWDFGGETMGTTWSVKLVPPSGPDLSDFQRAIEEELAQVIALFSHWERRSELSRFNAAPSGFWAVSEPFWEVMTAVLDLADETDGAVDPTLGALVDLWGFGPPGPRPLDGEGPSRTAPSDEEIEAARAVSGWGRLRLNRDARAIQQPGGLKLDLSGLAKGHAVDCVSDRLTAMGAASHLVEIGGELIGRGVKPDARPWWTELQGPPGAPGPRTVAALFDIAVATSGDWVRRFEAGGYSYSHTLDRRTGRPIINNVAAVTVFADTALRADGLATALTVMGPIDGPAYAETSGIAAAFLVRSADGRLTETVTPAWSAMLDEGA